MNSNYLLYGLSNQIKNYNKFIIIYLLVFFPISAEQIKSQCPGSETCEDAYVFCSLDDLNGFSCTLNSTTKTPCRNGCVGNGNAGYKDWWAFFCQGGNATITVNIGNCANPNIDGNVVGFWGACDCGEEVLCVPYALRSNTSFVYQLNDLKPCKKYYISFEHVASYCDFTITTSGGGAPSFTLSDINNIPSRKIEPVCVGECYNFFVESQGTCTAPNYIWTLDGIVVGGNNKNIQIVFPDQGDFIICVTGSIGNTAGCRAGPKCATVKVRPLPDRNGVPRKVCYGQNWHTQHIYDSGIYREQFTDSKCCKYDSVVNFTVLPDAQTENVFYLSCDNKPYIDILGRSYASCKDHFYIKLQNSTIPYKCDSSIVLTSICIKDSLNWQSKCIGGNVEHSPNFNIINQCGIGESYKFEYNWYKKSDTTKASISTNEQLIVEPINEDYCLDVKVKVYLGSDSALCIKTYCDTINEAQSGASIENILLPFCDSAYFNGKIYFASDTFTQKLQSAFGCDSIINTIINIQKTSIIGLNLTTCDSLTVNGQIYFQSGDYTQSFHSLNGCDSLLEIHAAINNSKTSAISQSKCDSALINGQWYFQSGNFTQSLQTFKGCDSTLNIDLNIFKSSNRSAAFIACDSLNINGHVYTQSDSFMERLVTINGCDSLVNVNLTINKSSVQNFSFSDCDSVNYNGKIYKQSGDYPETYQSVDGCDSTINIHINITNSNTSPFKLKKCDSVTINGKYYDQSGNYIQKLTSANGCDSTLNIDLTIGKSSSFNYQYTTCDSTLINGKWYYQSGNYLQTLQNTNYCDSSLNIDLEIKLSTNGDTLFRSCDSVTINGITYKQTGIYQQKLVNSVQCDSILIIEFTRLSKSSSNVIYRSCDSISVNGKVYNKSGIYTQILSNINQCDSLLSLVITIGKSNSTDWNQTGCDSISINGKIYHQSGHYTQDLTNKDNCDSTLNLDLSINKSSFRNINLKTCDSIRIGGKVYTQSTNLTQLLKDEHQCDSIVNTQIQIDKSSQNTMVQSGCDSLTVNGNVYYINGQYTQHLQSSAGCDSMLHLDLTIKPGNPSTLDAGVDTSVCEGDIIKLNGVFSGQANFNWFSNFGIFNNPNNLLTSYYSNSIGFDKIYLQAKDDCKQWLDSLNIKILPRQIVQVTGDTLISPCKEITFTATGGIKYTWIPSSYIECLDPPCSRVLLKSSLATRFTISTDGPCAVPANLNLSVASIQTDVYLPNAFSPNDDNINDVFLPVFNCEQVDFYDLQIFDRWGNLIFESQNKDKGWNGKYQDQNMNPGVYPYMVQYQIHGSERKVKAGDVTLVR